MNEQNGDLSAEGKEDILRIVRDAEKIRREVAFNEGSDARIGGKSIFRCPYTDETVERRSWVYGWHHAHNFWGEAVKGRWRYRSLPPIAGFFPLRTILPR